MSAAGERLPFEKVSLVVPLFNEAANLPALYARLTEALQGLGRPYEIIVVDDGSRDASFDGLLALHQQDARLKVVKLRRNFGQHAATFAGFDHASGDAVVTIDADLQNDPADIEKLLAKLAEGYDVVSGWRTNRQDPALRRKLPSLMVNWFISSRTGLYLHDYGCGLKAYTRQAAKEVARYGQTDGWYPILFGWLGFAAAEVQVTHYPRAGGQGSRYNLFQQMNQFMSLFTGLATRPFQLVELLGAGIAALGGLALVWALAAALLGRASQVPWALMGGALGLVGGAMLGVLGLLGEYLIRIYYEVKQNPKYLVARIVE